MRSLEERAHVPDELIPADWATNYSAPTSDAFKGPSHDARHEKAVRMWLECTGRADKELPAAEGQEQAEEAAVTAAAEVLFTDFLKGRLCFGCAVPALRMQRCSRCTQARYCSRECQRAHWATHKQACVAAAPAAAAASKDGAEAAAMAAAPAPAGAAAQPAAAAAGEEKP